MKQRFRRCNCLTKLMLNREVEPNQRESIIPVALFGLWLLAITNGAILELAVAVRGVSRSREGWIPKPSGL